MGWKKFIFLNELKQGCPRNKIQLQKREIERERERERERKNRKTEGECGNVRVRARAVSTNQMREPNREQHYTEIITQNYRQKSLPSILSRQKVMTYRNTLYLKTNWSIQIIIKI